MIKWRKESVNVLCLHADPFQHHSSAPPQAKKTLAVLYPGLSLPVGTQVPTVVPRDAVLPLCLPMAPPKISVHPGPRSTQVLAIRVAKMAFFTLLIYLTRDFRLVLSQVLILLCRQEPICTLNQREKTR